MPYQQHHAPVSLAFLHPGWSHQLRSCPQAGPARPDHGSPKLMQPHPRRLVTAQAKNPLQALGTGDILLAGHPPDSAKPHSQRQSGPFKDRSRLCRYLIVTSGALLQATAHNPALRVPASRANEPAGPAQSTRILDTRHFIGKLPLKVGQSLRVFLALAGKGPTRVDPFHLKPKFMESVAGFPSSVAYPPSFPAQAADSQSETTGRVISRFNCFESHSQ